MALDPTVQRSVGADMERIFGPADTLIVARDLEEAPWVAQALALRQPRRRLLRRVALAASTIMVLALALTARHHDVDNGSVTPASRPAAPASSPPRAQPLKREPVPSMAATPDHDALASEQISLPRDMSEQTLSRRPHELSGPPVRSIALRVDRPPPREVRGLVAVTPHTRPYRDETVASRSAAEGVCAGGEGSDACIYHDVAAADRRLRDAYADAVRDGAPAGILANIRNSWRKATGLSLREPDEAIDRYDRLTDELRSLEGAAPR